MMRDFFYKIDGFIPPRENEDYGGWGFDVKLDVDMARRALQKPLTEYVYDILKKRGNEIVNLSGLLLGLYFIENPIIFFS